MNLSTEGCLVTGWSKIREAPDLLSWAQALRSLFSILGFPCSFDALGKQAFGFLQLRPPIGAKAAAGSIDEVGQHPHPRSGALRGYFSRRQRPGDCGGTFRKQSLGRMRRVGRDFRYPAFFLSRRHTTPPSSPDPCRSANDEPDKSACLCAGPPPIYVTLCPAGPTKQPSQLCLKYCTAFSCASAARLVVNVPRFRRFPVVAFFLREYKRYWPLFSFRIM
jgi:hypothetical protein